jgi:hypothetical protein
MGDWEFDTRRSPSLARSQTIKGRGAGEVTLKVIREEI